LCEQISPKGRFFFLPSIQFEQKKENSVVNVDAIFGAQSNEPLIISLLTQTITTGNNTRGYDFMLIMLPDVASHESIIGSGNASKNRTFANKRIEHSQYTCVDQSISLRLKSQSTFSYVRLFIRGRDDTVFRISTVSYKIK
jgi:hypothetical protein